MRKVKIKSIKKLEYKENRYDLTVNSTHNFFANGILIHNTSGRVGFVISERDMTLKEKIAKWFGIDVNTRIWKYLNGTRRVVIEESSGTQFHDPTIRDKAFKLFKDKLRKGETVYFEIVGYESTGASIMPSVSTEKLNDKEFTKKYGKVMPFSYGCNPKESEVYVYRITFANEDGQVIDYCWDDVIKRCNELEVKHVPELLRITFDEIAEEIKAQTGEDSVDDRSVQARFFEIVEELAKGPSTVDSSHIREGICVKIDNGGLNNRTYKHKSFEFKFLEGIIKDSGVVDQEEAEDSKEEN